MSIVVTCKSCGTRSSAPDEADGKTVTCPKCGSQMVVRRADGVSEAALEKLFQAVSTSEKRSTDRGGQGIPSPPVPPPIATDKRRLPDLNVHRQRLAIAIAASIGMVATFLPWIRAPFIGSINGTAGDGWITLALFVPALLLAFQGRMSEPVVGTARWIATVPAGVAVAIGIQKIVVFNSFGERDNPFERATQIEIGVFVLIAAGAALILTAWKMAKPRY